MMIKQVKACVHAHCKVYPTDNVGYAHCDDCGAALPLASLLRFIAEKLEPASADFLRSLALQMENLRILMIELMSIGNGRQTNDSRR